MCNVLVNFVGLNCQLQNMAKAFLEEVAKELKLVKVVVASR